ncbi:multiple sugar transport system ATP-binding protein [Rhizobium sp. BK313]|uniref:ABC transporter ATP-binding protein n=1 Tax=Rhizobium sp. BK313 TaxID=2587081 RepID=UPI00105EFCB6|nr:ABC transporter ATP-binding protein [Rhizobium sp. BK313]MBB3456386.1 multiple sugar transport system ATP-binding protein [Rhizobium sp. BK313]
MATVSLDRITKSFGAFTALHDLSLDIEDREFLVLLGPSGCGKTTTMRMIAGLEDPTSGDIRIDGERVNDKPARDRDLAMVFQNYGLYPHMTVADNIGYPLKVRGMARQERLERIKAAAARVELSNLLERKPGELSGGQRQRVALARAIVRTPRLFLMDEPLSNLDAKLRNLMRAQLKHLQRDLAITTIYVTHDQTEAMTLADRIVIMRDGRIQQSGSPAEIYEKPGNAFVASFIGSPPMNLINGTIANGKFVHAAGSVPVSGLPDGPIILGVRPEDIKLSEPGAADITGTVFSSELLGDSVLLGVTAGTDLINVKVGPRNGRQIGEPISIGLDRGKLHAFDAQHHNSIMERRP